MSEYDTIRWSIDTLESIVSQLQSTQKEILNQKNRVHAVYSWIDRESGSDVRVSGCLQLNCGVSVKNGEVKSVLAGYKSAMNNCAEGIDNLSQAVYGVCNLIADAEKKIVGRISSLETSVSLQENSSKTDKIFEATGAVVQTTVGKVKNAFIEMVDNWKTGAWILRGQLESCVAAFQADWEAKGITYRVIKGAGAVVDIVAGIAVVAGAIAGTGVTAGASAPVSCLVGVYGANTAISGMADLYNCITGNVDDVGEVNLLEWGLTGLGGQVGEWLGNREMGENIGEVTYIAGGLTTAIVSIKNLYGEIQQSKTAAKTLKESTSAAKNMLSGAAKEIPEALDGLGYIVKECDVRDIPYQFSQFAKQIPNITNVISEAKLVEKGVSSAQKLIEAGVKSVNTLTGWSLIDQPVFFKSSFDDTPIKQVSDLMNNVEDKLDSVKDAYKEIKNAFSIAFI